MQHGLQPDDLRSDHQRSDRRDDYAIEARGLVKTYPGPRAAKVKTRVRALDGLTLTVPRGAIFTLVGPNGAGKSTAVKILTSLARPDEGTARVEGIDILRSPATVRRVIGVVGQRSGADPAATGRENLILQGHLYGLGTAAARRRADELLDRLGLSAAGGRFVKGYSGGMQRRLDVALGLVHRPRVLFLDEPTTGLDPEARAAMWQEIGQLAARDNMTVLLTTHYLEEADRLSDWVAIVDSGRVVATGTPAELKERAGVATLDDVYLHHAGRRFEMAHDIPRDPGAGFPRDRADGGTGGSSPRAEEVTRP
ncbi:MAG TPA: ATP-binding cassette domain-containing protein [Trebonia sp.]|nr:ATP-binding cassette domain-containing protein [Trebonia sp.]